MRLFKRGNYWWLDFVENGKRIKRSTKTKNKNHAEIIKREKEKELLLGNFLQDQMLISELIEQYENSVKAKYKPRSARRYCEVLAHIRKFFKKSSVTYANEVTRKDVEKYIIERKKADISSVTINFELGRMQQLWDYAVDIGVAMENPVKKTPKLQEKKRKLPRFLDNEEVSVFIETLGKHFPRVKEIAIFFLYTGLRRDELRLLRWEEINISMMKLRVIDGKGEKSRDIPLHRCALDALNAYYDKYYNNKPKEGIIFRNRIGNPYKRGNLYEAFRKAGEIAQIKGIIGVHTLRHTFGTHLAMAGVPVRTLQEYMGHSDIETTMIYLHLSESHWESEINRLNYPIVSETS